MKVDTVIKPKALTKIGWKNTNFKFAYFQIWEKTKENKVMLYDEVLNKVILISDVKK